MALLPDQKFSTFQSGGNPTTGDIVVGLRGGINTQFTWPTPSGISSITGTVNEVLVNGTSGAPITGAVTLTTPQPIAPTSSPTFSALTLTNTGTSLTTLGGALFGNSSGALTPATGNLQVVNQGGQANLFTESYVNLPGSAPTYWCYKSRSTSVGSFVAVQTNDTLGRLEFFGDDGTQFTQAADIVCTAVGTISNGVVPGKISIATASSLGVLTNALVIDQNQLTTVVALSANSTITAGSTIQATSAAVISGSTAGGVTGEFVGYSIGANLGTLAVQCANNAGNYSNVLINASTSAARTWTLPDATGTLALTSGIPSLGNYSFSGNNMTVSSGTMNFNLPNSNLTLVGSSDVNINATTSNVAGSPYYAMSRNSTLIGAVQAGATSAGASGGTGMLYFNGIANGSHFFFTNGATFATLSPLGSTIAQGALEISVGELHIGNATGGGAQIIDIFAPTASKGVFQFLSADNAGNFTARLTHSSISASRTWTLPDATGTIALTSGASGIINSGTTNQLAYYASNGTTLSGLATANNGVLVTSGGGVPSISSTLPTAVQDNITELGIQSTFIGFHLPAVGAATTGLYVDNANDGTFAMQCGPGSVGLGGGYTMFGSNHASFGGWTKACISAQAGAKFAVNSSGWNAGGTDIFTVDRSGNVVANGLITGTAFSPSTTSGIIGTTTNDNAAAGSVGEEFETVLLSSGSLVSLTSGTITNIVQITNLPAGDWDIWGNWGLDVAGASTVSVVTGWVNSASATLVDLAYQSRLENQTANNSDFCLPIASRRFPLAAPTTVYMTMLASYTGGTVKGFGAIYARRRR